MEKKKFLTIGAGIVVLIAIILIVLSVSQPGKVNVVTEKTEYKIGDNLKVKIENDLKESLCFSSCYPYYLEKNEEEGWEDYSYVDCPTANLVEGCVSPKQIKAYEFTIPSIETGLHRLALPACIGCNLQEAFRKDQWFYSNDFIVE